MHTTPCHYEYVVYQKDQSYWKVMEAMSELEDRDFLQANLVWYQTYRPMVEELITKCQQENPGKVIPSVETVLGIIKQESNGATWANRFEPTFKSWLMTRLGADIKKFGNSISRDTELHNRATSFGLMQIMGQTARERGFSGEFLTELCKPEIGLRYGIKHIVELISKYPQEDQWISAYNAGSPTTKNKSYVIAVKRYRDAFKNVASIKI